MTDFHKPLADALAKLQGRRQRSLPPEQDNHAPLPEPRPALSLDLWPDNMRGMPNAILRGALFGVSKQRDVTVKRELIASVEGVEVWFRGEKFNQTDLDVWQMLLHLARLSPLGDKIAFTAHSFLLQLGRSTSGRQYELLKEDIARLIGGVVEIAWTREKKTFTGALVTSMYRDEETQCLVVTLNPKLVTLYESGYTQIYWPHRMALKSNNLAKWLHGFYASHASPYPYKVATLRKLCGSRQDELRGFRRLLRQALELLVQTSALASWEIDADDLVKVVPIPSISQHRHLVRKGRRRPSSA